MGDKKEITVTEQVKNFLAKDMTKKRFTEVLGKKAPQFMTSIINVVNGSDKLQECNPGSIIAAALVAATYDLPIDGNLGFAAIVPYRNRNKMEAQFQMMYKGFVQLAIRSGYYERMNCAVVYEDELVSYNPITGEAVFVDDFSQCTQRASGDESKIAGFYAWFRLKVGFSHDLYMTKQAVENHAKKYSSSYRYDLNNGKKSSRWSTDFQAMGLKTVIKQLLSKWGILSVEMQKAVVDDQQVFDVEGDGRYSDNMQTVEAEEVIDVFAQESQEQKMITEEPKQQMPIMSHDAKETVTVDREPVMQSDYAAFEEQYSQGMFDDFAIPDDGPDELPFR